MNYLLAHFVCCFDALCRSVSVSFIFFYFVLVVATVSFNVILYRFTFVIRTPIKILLFCYTPANKACFAVGGDKTALVRCWIAICIFYSNNKRALRASAEVPLSLNLLLSIADEYTDLIQLGPIPTTSTTTVCSLASTELKFSLSSPPLDSLLLMSTRWKTKDVKTKEKRQRKRSLYF